MRKLMLVFLLGCGSLSAWGADQRQFWHSFDGLAERAWSPDRGYLQKCSRGLRGHAGSQEEMALVVALIGVGLTDYFEALARRFPMEQSTVKFIESEARSIAWKELQLESLQDIEHHANWRNRVLWIGTLRLVACHLETSLGYVSVSQQLLIRALLPKAARIEKLLQEFLASPEEERMIRFEVFREGVLRFSAEARALIDATATNIFIGYRSSSHLAILRVVATLLEGSR